MDLALHLKREFDIQFVDAGKEVLEDKLKQHGFQVDTIAFPLLNLRKSVRKLATLCREFQINIVHFNNRHDLLIAYFLSKEINIPIVLTMHTTIICGNIGMMANVRNLVYVGLYRLFGHCINQYITITKYNADLMSRWFGLKPERVSAIHNGVTAQAPNRLSLSCSDPAEPVIAVVSHLHPLKGIDVLLRALALLKEYPWTCLIMGEGLEHGRLLELSKLLGLQNRVIFTGFISREKVLDHVAKSSMVVLPSWFEGFPYSLLEAMSLAIPVITTKVQGLPEMILDGKNGLLVRPGRPVELADAIRKLLSDRNLAREMGREGFRLVEMQFSLEKMGSETAGVYRKLLG